MWCEIDKISVVCRYLIRSFVYNGFVFGWAESSCSSTAAVDADGAHTDVQSTCRTSLDIFVVQADVNILFDLVVIYDLGHGLHSIGLPDIETTLHCAAFDCKGISRSNRATTSDKDRHATKRSSHTAGFGGIGR